MPSSMIRLHLVCLPGPNKQKKIKTSSGLQLLIVLFEIYFMGGRNGNIKKIGRTINKCHHQNKVSYLFAGSQQVGKKQAKLFRITFVYRSI